MTDRQVEAYGIQKKPMDKAGAYGIQGKFAVFMSKALSGTTIMGGPVGECVRRLGSGEPSFKDTEYEQRQRKPEVRRLPLLSANSVVTSFREPGYSVPASSKNILQQFKAAFSNIKSFFQVSWALYRSIIVIMFSRGVSGN